MDVLPNWGFVIYLGDSSYNIEGLQFNRILIVLLLSFST